MVLFLLAVVLAVTSALRVDVMGLGQTSHLLSSRRV